MDNGFVLQGRIVCPSSSASSKIELWMKQKILSVK